MTDEFEEVDLDEYDVRQVFLTVREDGGRERHAMNVKKVLDAPALVVADKRDEGFARDV